jgi:hypothetical protein
MGIVETRFMEAMNMSIRNTIYLGAKGRRGTVLSAKGENLTSLNNHFSGLTPKLIEQIKPFVGRNIMDRISIPKTVVKVPATLLGTELRNISCETPVLLIKRGSEFNLISQDPGTVGDVVGIMEQILLPHDPSRFNIGKGKTMHFAVDQNLTNARGVKVWLDEIEGVTYNRTVGLFISLDRFFGSVNDHAEVAIPLNMTVTDYRVA